MSKHFKMEPEMPVKMAGQLAQLAELESITQEEGETLFSFITRIRLAAAYTDVLKFGTCSKKTHPDLTLEECKRGPNDEPATELSWPCAKGVRRPDCQRDPVGL